MYKHMNIYKYIFIYIYIYKYNLREFVLNYSHPGPRREQSRVGGCSSCANLGPLAAGGADGAEFHEVTSYSPYIYIYIYMMSM